jgi:uncharacterized membrane protein
MKLQTAFYIAGIIFLFFAVWYFAKEYLKQIPDSIKVIILILLIIASFVAGEILRERSR